MDDADAHPTKAEIMADLDRLGIDYDARWTRARLEELLREGGSAVEPEGEPEVAPEALTVEVTVAGKVHDGRGSTFPVGAVIPVTPDQAAGLRRQGFAK